MSFDESIDKNNAYVKRDLGAVGITENPLTLLIGCVASVPLQRSKRKGRWQTLFVRTRMLAAQATLLRWMVVRLNKGTR